MSKGNTFENDLVKLIFNATAIANIADNAAASPLTNLYISLQRPRSSYAARSTSDLGQRVSALLLTYSSN